MTPVELSDPIYHDEDAARTHLEATRWPHGAACPWCGSIDDVRPLAGGSMGPGWYYCAACQDKFTVRVGAVYERSHIPLHKWLLAFRLMASSKKGVSAHQLHRSLNITYKSAWFLAHRIREAMKPADSATPLGGEGKRVEADETYHGRVENPVDKGTRGPANKRAIVSLVERGGRARSFHVDHHPTSASVYELLAAHIARASVLNTDERRIYEDVGTRFADHEKVNHGQKEYVRGKSHTNSVEGYFSIFKRGMNGVYQHCSEAHLHRYLAEFDFRYSNRIKLGIDDCARTDRAIKGAAGKRLTYRQPRSSRGQSLTQG
jgi:transposase-like protein